MRALLASLMFLSACGGGGNVDPIIDLLPQPEAPIGEKAVLPTITYLHAQTPPGFHGAMVCKYGLSQLVPTNTNWVWTTYELVVYDTDGFFSEADRTKLTIPGGVTLVELRTQQIWNNNTVGFRQAVIKKNYPTDLGWYPGVPATTVSAITGTTTDLTAVTPAIPVVAGDFFQSEAYQTSGSNLLLSGSQGTCFSVRAI